MIPKCKEYTYSTEEQVIGKWIDGKPLYRKVLTTSTPSNLNVTTTILALDTTNIIQKFDGYIIYPEGTKNQHIPLNMTISNVVFHYTYSKNNELRMKLSTESSYISKNCVIILEYTKTTD